MKKTIAFALALIVVISLLAGCSKPAYQQGDPIPPDLTAIHQSELPDSGAPSAKITAEADDAQGKLIGWIDANSVEIEMTPTDTLAFRTAEVLEQLEGISDGDLVKFSYTHNESGQLVISKIEKMN